ncbi:PF13590 domain protein [Leptospira broomii serovar Hurstbridge str. 5399]|uniref:PF13590 domain protein n=1 Tax=Leptospira broomii serovar Hurstbridge str. 5399 TaxID=1049789 RepID=T0FE53_9LEPT|nr:DUF4136 domain-containing protein [Leptospira broomii]EQA46131.1 PF13590 domain protein [Leptospira broomii serovar Hurstbridge str. 5399]
MKLIRNSLLLLQFLCLGCTSAQIQSSYDTSLDFAKYKTFDWYPSKEKNDEKYFGDFSVQREIRFLLRRELEGRGLTLNSKKPDLLVEFHGVVESKLVEERVPAFSGMSYGYSPYYYGGPPIGALPYYGGYNSMYPYGYNNVPYQIPNQSHVQEFKDGTLLVDIVDRKTNQLVWRGWAEDSLEDLDDLKNELKSEIPKLMKGYPNSSKR